jgi:hypothetical protein
MYTTTAEYRQIFRSYFKMDVADLEQEYSELKESDPESYDELLYDDKAMDVGLTLIYESTKHDKRFIDLYVLAAGRFISEDHNTGLCVLLTYDYFADFITLYENPTDEGFSRLTSRLS